MLVREVIEIIRFNTSTKDDLSGKSQNLLFQNRAIVQRLLFALDEYAVKTKAIEGLYTLPLNNTIKYIEAPYLALRSETYRMMVVYIQGRAYCLQMPDWNLAYTDFPYEIVSIPRFVVPWQNMLYFYPANGNSYNQTTVTEPVSKTDTTIYVENAGSFPLKFGFVTIGEEKIAYNYRDTTTLYDCTRGIEETTASSHNKGDDVLENNLRIFYYRKHFRMPCVDNNIENEPWINQEIEVCDEHIKGITDYVSGILLSKNDVGRAQAYKDSFDKFIVDASDYILNNRNKIMPGGDIDVPALWETNNYLGYNM